VDFFRLIGCLIILFFVGHYFTGFDGVVGLLFKLVTIAIAVWAAFWFLILGGAIAAVKWVQLHLTGGI